MMRFCLCLFLGLVLSLLGGCSKDSKGKDMTDFTRPTLVSSSILNDAADVSVGEQTIRLTFDQNVTLANPLAIRLNGEAVLSASAAFKDLQIKVNLQQGTSYSLNVPSQTVKGPTGLFADEIRISFETRGSQEQNITTQLVVADPSPEARNVYDFLRQNYEQKTVSGAMANVSWNTNEAEWVYKHTGKYPALNCFDYIHHYASPSSWIDYNNIQVAEDWWSANGLVAAMWHWNVPRSAGSSDYAFYTKDTDFDLTKALVSGTAEHALLQADLDKVGDYLLLMKAKNIPVIWRPLHEAAGKWFWWGAKDAASYRQLWIMMFETFAEKGLNNLIWVWTSEINDDAWYPGDQYVDMIGCDLYNRTAATEVAAIYDKLQENYPNKIIALSEFGNVAAFTAQWSNGATWSWIMPWYDYDRTVNTAATAFEARSHQHANVGYWEALFVSDKVISRDQMPNLK